VRLLKLKICHASMLEIIQEVTLPRATRASWALVEGMQVPSRDVRALLVHCRGDSILDERFEARLMLLLT